MRLAELENLMDIDIKNSLVRFGNMENFYIKYLKKFIDDSSLDRISKGIENKDIKLISESAHTLKGVSGNLGLKKIYELSVELMKAQDLSDDKIEYLYKELKEEIEKSREVLKRLD